MPTDNNAVEPATQDANTATCESMDAATLAAAEWETCIISGEAMAWLKAWVRLRMQAYDEGAKASGSSWDRDSMSEWIAMDLALDDKDARTLCHVVGWPVQEASS